MTAAYLLPPLIDRLMAAIPNLGIDIGADNSVRDLQLRDADIVFRHVRPEQPDLIAKLIYGDPTRFYAIRRYSDTYRHPKLGSNLCQHQFVSFGNVERILGICDQLDST